jgi:hypothetical protein
MSISWMEHQGIFCTSKWRGVIFPGHRHRQKSAHQKEAIKAKAIMVNTVEQNKTRYFAHDVKRAEHARKTQVTHS